MDFRQTQYSEEDRQNLLQNTMRRAQTPWLAVTKGAISGGNTAKLIQYQLECTMPRETLVLTCMLRWALHYFQNSLEETAFLRFPVQVTVKFIWICAEGEDSGVSLNRKLPVRQ